MAPERDHKLGIGARTITKARPRAAGGRENHLILAIAGRWWTCWKSDRGRRVGDCVVAGASESEVALGSLRGDHVKWSWGCFLVLCMDGWGLGASNHKRIISSSDSPWCVVPSQHDNIRIPSPPWSSIHPRCVWFTRNKGLSSCAWGGPILLVLRCYLRLTFTFRTSGGRLIRPFLVACHWSALPSFGNPKQMDYFHHQHCC